MINIDNQQSFRLRAVSSGRRFLKSLIMSEKELEELKEANYKLKLNLESSRQSHMVEVEYLKEEVQVKENELRTLGDKLKADFKQHIGSLQERVNSSIQFELDI